MSNHIFKSPDGKYIAKTKMATILFNRLTKSELTSNEANEIRNKYNWSLDTSKEEKDIVIQCIYNGSVNRTVSRLCFLFFASYLCADFISAYK